MTLIEMVRQTRKNGHRYCAVDKNKILFTYLHKPGLTNKLWTSYGPKYTMIGHYNLTCDWRKTLIDVDKILVK